MAKLLVFDIVIEPSASFYSDIFRPGDWIQGHVRIHLSAPKDDIRGIKIKVLGEAYAHWSEGSGDNRRSYTGRQIYFKEKTLCWGNSKQDAGATKQSLPAGEHQFPFNFLIPNIPMPLPFEGGTGWIRYKVMCKIDRPWKFNHNTERLFNIIGDSVDLNTIPTALYPVHQESSKTVCCLCCATGPIITKASTDKSAYVPGERIFVSGIVENNSSRRILDLTAKLVQLVTFRSNSGHTRKRKTTIVSEKDPGCNEGEMAQMNWKPLVIPPIPPTSSDCIVIRIDYLVEFVGDVESTPFDAEVLLPVVIGTIPIYQPPNAYPSAPVSEQPTSSISPPPSYDVAAGGLQEIPSRNGFDYTFGKLMYAPQYATYNDLPVQIPTWDPQHPPEVGSPAYPGGPPPSGGPGYPPYP